MPGPEDLIKVKINALDALTGDVADDDLIPIWDTSAGVTRKIPVSALPFSTGGGGGGVDNVGSPFKVFSISESYTFEGGNTIIQDPRLLGKTGFLVYATQLGLEFRDDQLQYDPDNSIVTIPGFELLPGEHISISIDGIPTETSITFTAAVMARIAALEAMTAPILSGKGSVWFRGALADIPAGWEEDTAMQGLLPLHRDPDDVDFATIGNTIGSKTHTNTEEEMVPHVHSQYGVLSHNSGTSGSGAGNGTSNTGSAGGWIDPDGSPSVKVAKPYSIINPAKIGFWIKYVGV